MEQKIVTSNNGYGKKLLRYAVLGIFCCIAAYGGMGIIGEYHDLEQMLYDSGVYTLLGVLIIGGFAVSLFLLIFAISIQKVELTVTSKRVYGATAFGKRVDLPLDSVSSVGMSSFKGIAVGTSSGRIVFKGIGNRDEIYEVINKLIIERQDKASAEPVKQEVPASSLDEIKKLKELLDTGVITQEEFDAKKKQLLGL